jgi:hypothetical protein
VHMKLSHRNRGQVQQTKCSLICKIRSLVNCNFMPIFSKNKTKIPNRDMQGSGPLCQVFFESRTLCQVALEVKLTRDLNLYCEAV